MWGVLAVLHAQPEGNAVAAELHEALYLLQHRGQDACGITTCQHPARIHQCKGNGLASKVFRDGARIQDLPGYMGRSCLSTMQKEKNSRGLQVWDTSATRQLEHLPMLRRNPFM